MVVVVYAVGALLALLLCALALWPWAWPVPSAPTWAPVVVLVTCAVALWWSEPPELVLVFAVWPAMVALFVLATRLTWWARERRAADLRRRAPGG